ncbi:MAG: hypothetical protein IIA91_00705 [Chloroflexi bacterium]|nr:hypothetical protein [Chloroflexota bacterium]
MVTVSRWRSSRPVRLRLDIVGLEVFLLAFMVFLAGLSELPSFVWFVLVGVSVVLQSVLFYNIGRVREKLGS